jgi:hypothetical protein
MSRPILNLSIALLVVSTSAAIAAKKHAPAVARATPAAPTGSTQAIVYKDNVAVHQAASLTSPTLGSLSKGSPIDVQRQEGLWFNVRAQPGTAGYVRINEIRLAQPAAGKGDGYSMFTGGSHAKLSETAGVRGINETQLRTATMDEAALAAMQAQRVDDAAANAYASRMHLQRTQLAYKDEPGVGKGHRAPSVSASQSPEQAQMAQQQDRAVKTGVLSMIGGRFGLGSSAGSAVDAIPKSEQEKVDEETAMGPQVAGRMLGALPLWNDPQAQQRVNMIGRWVAMQTPRDDLPWSFAVLDTDEINAFAAPGGYVFMTRGLYQVLQSDDEVAAVLGHEISHVVARDHYNVIHKQAMTSVASTIVIDKATSHAGVAGQFANYFAKEGATIFLTKFDRDVEYRSDSGSLIYVSRAGYNPLAMYAVLQKLAAVSDSTGRMADLYKTHPSATERLDRLDQKGLANVEQFADRPYVR